MRIAYQVIGSSGWEINCIYPFPSVADWFVSAKICLFVSSIIVWLVTVLCKGQIPSELGQLTKLNNLNFKTNSLSGTIMLTDLGATIESYYNCS